MPLPAGLHDPVVIGVRVLLACLCALAGTSMADRRVSTGASASAAQDVQTIRLGVARGRSVRVARLALEDYIAQVVAGEGDARAPDAALQALAVAARTFALANRHRHRREGFDLCDTTHCQVVRPATPASRRAALASAGRILAQDGQPAFVFYSAWCGGRMERASAVWPGATDYFTGPAPHDEECQDEPAWTSEIGRADLERALRAAGLNGRRLRGLRVLQRSDSGRVARLGADGFTPNEVSGQDLRMALIQVVGPHALRSTAFDVRATARGYRFTGRGYGHGVGLCVVGAGRRAARGATADEILQVYFPTLRLEASATADAAVPAGPPSRPAAATPTRAADVTFGRFEPASPDRVAITDAVRRARDDIAARTAVRPPSTIRVTVHPTVESFSRATGEPWWVPSASSGASMELAPPAVLRQQGQFDRAIRRAVAHMIIADVLAGRPLWVPEGVASYFAAPPEASSGEVPARVACPADAELQRPISAGAHRDALARAEICVRRAIAQGRSWRALR